MTRENIDHEIDRLGLEEFERRLANAAPGPEKDRVQAQLNLRRQRSIDASAQRSEQREIELVTAAKRSADAAESSADSARFSKWIAVIAAVVAAVAGGFEIFGG